MKHNKWGIWVAMGAVVVTSLACGGGGGDDATPNATPQPAQQKQTLMNNAHTNGETIFEYDAEQNTRYALYYGAKHIVFLKPHVTRTVKLTSSECINLSVRKQIGDDWNVVYSFQHLSPGDYVLFDGSWRVTSYTP